MIKTKRDLLPLGVQDSLSVNHSHSDWSKKKKKKKSHMYFFRLMGVKRPCVRLLSLKSVFHCESEADHPWITVEPHMRRGNINSATWHWTADWCHRLQKAASALHPGAMQAKLHLAMLQISLQCKTATVGWECKVKQSFTAPERQRAEKLLATASAEVDAQQLCQCFTFSVWKHMKNVWDCCTKTHWVGGTFS